MATKLFYIIDSEAKREKAADIVASLPRTPLMCVDIKEYKETRSAAQNRIFHSWVSYLAKHLGYTDDNMKHEIKKHFLGYHTYTDKDGETWREVAHTASLTVSEFSDLLVKVEALGNWAGVILPRLDDYMYAIYGERIK